MMRVSNCVARDALIETILRVEMPKQTRKSLLGMIEDPNGQRALANWIKGLGGVIKGGSDCPDHPSDGITIVIPEEGIEEVYGEMVAARRAGASAEKQINLAYNILGRLKRGEKPKLNSERVLRAEVELTLALNE